MKYVASEKGAIAYTTKGKGFPLVLLHGFCEDSTVWDEFKTDLLEENYKVIAIDLPGFGKSELAAEEVSMSDFAEVVHAVVEELALEKIILIGHSMGGYAGLAFAEKYGGKLAGLGLFHSHPYPDSEEKKAGRQKGIDFIKRQGHVLYVKQLFPNLFAPTFVKSNAFLLEKLTFRASRYRSEGIIAALAAMKNRPDRSEVLKNIQVPVLFIIGGKDTTVPAEQSLEQTHLPAVSSVHLLEKVAHMGMFEARKQSQLIVRQFVEFCLNTQ